MRRNQITAIAALAVAAAALGGCKPEEQAGPDGKSTASQRRMPDDGGYAYIRKWRDPETGCQYIIAGGGGEGMAIVQSADACRKDS